MAIRILDAAGSPLESMTTRTGQAIAIVVEIDGDELTEARNAERSVSIMDASRAEWNPSSVLVSLMATRPNGAVHIPFECAAGLQRVGYFELQVRDSSTMQPLGNRMMIHCEAGDAEPAQPQTGVDESRADIPPADTPPADGNVATRGPEPKSEVHRPPERQPPSQSPPPHGLLRTIREWWQGLTLEQALAHILRALAVGMIIAMFICPTILLLWLADHILHFGQDIPVAIEAKAERRNEKELAAQVDKLTATIEKAAVAQQQASKAGDEDGQKKSKDEVDDPNHLKACLNVIPCVYGKKQ